ncbi:MAG: ATP-binding protein [Polyangiaceae bacterium]|nr:ATP-binding protein [Polyangiaceae bacterium]
MKSKLLTLYGLKFNPFRPDVPIEAIYASPAIESFCLRTAAAVQDGGFVMITGDPGMGKSVVLRLLAHQIKQLPDVAVGSIDHPQSGVPDFYRELGDIFAVPLRASNRWGGFKALRARWAEHIGQTLMRPVLVIDEAQEMHDDVLSELRLLASKDFDSRALLCVVFAGDNRLPDRFRRPELVPLGSRIRRRLNLEQASHDDLAACLDHLLASAGNATLMSSALKTTLVEHAVGNYRIMMHMGDELLTAAAERNAAQLDEKLFLDVFHVQRPKSGGKRR